MPDNKVATLMGSLRLLFSKIILYGTLGLVLEIWFTGLHSLFLGDRTAVSHTYLWMMVVYGSTALILEQISERIHVHILLKAIIYVPVIYISEFSWGLLSKLILGKCLWDYGGAGISILNVIRLDYGVFWYLAAMSFEWIYTKANKLFRYVNFNVVTKL